MSPHAPMVRTRARGHRRWLGLGLIVALALLAAACQPPPPLGTLTFQSAAAPQWPLIGDPAVLFDGGHYYAYSSNTNSNRLPVHVVDSLTRTYSIPEWDQIVQEGMPTKPAWAADNALWAPTVAKVGNTYVLYFAADRINPPDPNNRQCIGRATASAPQGPFVAEPVPFSCGIGSTGGALDPFLFKGPNGAFTLYAAFGNTESPIYAIPLDANANAGRTAGGYAPYWAFPVLGKRYAWEGRFIENPSMAYDPSTNTYILTYSAGDWWTPGYSTGLARCSTPIGVCVSNPFGPWLASSNGRTGVGGLSFFMGGDGNMKAVYASFNANEEGTSARRYGTVAGVSFGWSPFLGAA